VHGITLDGEIYGPVRRNDEVIAAKIIVYAEDAEEYFSFTASEADYEIEKLMKYCRDSGGVIDGSSSVLKSIWDTNNTICYRA
jgi:hypothetical protein